MTQEEFDKLLPGDLVELLDRNLQRTGEIGKVMNRMLGSKLVRIQFPGKNPQRISNCIRLAFPSVEEEKEN